MNSTALPLYYFPSTICFLDDDSLFLESINIVYSEKFNCQLYTSPKEMLDFILNYQSPFLNANFTKEYITTDEHSTSNRSTLDLNIQTISKIYENPLKNNEISLMVVDFNMPMMTGLEFYEKIKNSTVKKILLTGEANHKKVVEAFNSGLIDCFIHKEDNNLAEELNRYIKTLTYQYFCKKTSHLLSYLETSHPSVLSDSIFVEFFNNWCTENKIKEFYLINKLGSFLTVNENNEKIYFIVMGEYHANEFLKLNDDCVDKVGDLLQQVTEGKMIPFFGIDKECWDVSFDEWPNHFYAANILFGRERYAWAVVHNQATDQ